MQGTMERHRVAVPTRKEGARRDNLFLRYVREQEPHTLVAAGLCPQQGSWRPRGCLLSTGTLSN